MTPRVQYRLVSQGENEENMQKMPMVRKAKKTTTAIAHKNMKSSRVNLTTIAYKVSPKTIARVIPAATITV